MTIKNKFQFIDMTQKSLCIMEENRPEISSYIDCKIIGSIWS